MKTAAFGCFNEASKDSLDTEYCCSPGGNGGPGWRTVNVPFLPLDTPLPTASFLVAPNLQEAPLSHHLLLAFSPPGSGSCLLALGETILPPLAFPGSAWT